MDKNSQEQQSLFDKKEVVASIMQNLTAIYEKLDSGVDITDLSKEEQTFVTGLSASMGFTQDPVQPQRMNNEISPFSKLMVSVGETFTKSKKAFSMWKGFDPQIPKEKIEPNMDSTAPKRATLAEQFNARFSPVAAKINASASDINNSVKSKIENSTNGINNGVNSVKSSLGNGVNSVNSTIDGVADKISLSIEGLKQSIERKKLSVNEKFFEIYDDVTLSRLKVQQSVENKFTSTKESVSSFVEKFEEPWISIRGLDKVPSLEEMSYKTGLFAGKMAKKLFNALDNLFDKAENKTEPSVEPVQFAMQDSAGPAEKPLGSDTPPAPKTETTADTPSGEVPASAVAGQPTATATATVAASTPESESMIGSRVKPLSPETEAILKEKREDMKEEKKEDKVEETVKTEPPVERKSFLQRAKKFFSYKADGPDIPDNRYNIDASVKDISLPHFARSVETKKLPEIRDIFAETENRLKENVGIRVHGNGGYDLRKSWFNKEGDIVSSHERVRNIAEQTIPAYIKEFKLATDYLYSVNAKSKANPIINAYSDLAKKLGGDASADLEAINMLKAAQFSEEAKNEIKKLNIKNVDVLLENLGDSLFVIKDDTHHLKAAEFNLAVVANAGNAIRAELTLMREQHPEVKSILKDFNDVHVIRGVTMGDLTFKAVHKDFGDILKEPGNENLVIRENASILKNIASYKEAKMEETLNTKGLNNKDVEFGFDEKVVSATAASPVVRQDLNSHLVSEEPENRQLFTSRTADNSNFNATFSIASSAQAYLPQTDGAIQVQIANGKLSQQKGQMMYAQNQAILSQAIARDAANGSAPILGTPALNFNYYNTPTVQHPLSIPRFQDVSKASFVNPILPVAAPIGKAPTPPEGFDTSLISGQQQVVGITKPTTETRKSLNPAEDVEKVQVLTTRVPRAF